MSRKVLASQLYPAEVWPYASVEIVRASAVAIDPAPVDVETEAAAAFHAFLADPATAGRLDALRAEFAALDAEQLEADREARAREDADADEQRGSTCGTNCGWCGACS